MEDVNFTINRLEQQLFGIRQELYNLSMNVVSDNIPQKQKIDYLEYEIVSIQNQIQMLKRFTGQVHIQPAQPINVNMPVRNNIENRPIQQNNVAQSRIQSKSFEKLFGRSFMGVFASVLIFISFCIFGAVVIPHLSDVIKLIGMYAISFTITGVGVFLHKKDDRNKFFLVLLSIGTSTLYISLLLTNVYFKFINNITMYVCIIAWAGLVRYLCKYKTILFQIIGYIGIWISIFAGVIICASNGDNAMMLMLVIFYILCQFIIADMDRIYLWIFNLRDNSGTRLSYRKHLHTHIIKPLIVVVFWLGYIFLEPDFLYYIGLLLLIAHLVMDYVFAMVEECTLSISYSVISVVDLLLMIGLFHQTYFTGNIGLCVFAYIATVALLASIEYKELSIKIVAQIMCFIIIAVFCMAQDFMAEHLYVYLTVLASSVYGKLTKSKVYQYATIAYVFGLFAIVWQMHDGLYALEPAMLFIVTCTSLIVLFYRNEYSMVNAIGYLALMFTIGVFCNNFINATIRAYSGSLESRDMSNTLSFLIATIVHLVIAYTGYLGDNIYIDRVLYAVNGFLMIEGCTLMDNNYMTIIVVCFTLMLFLLNNKDLIAVNENYGYYIAAKFTIFIISVLYALSAIGYVISICLLMFAIGSICLGFYRNIKSFRLYGLLLSFVSVLKLLLFDIHYDSAIYNALGLFIGGVLCLVISFIYHKIDVNFKDK